MALNPIPPSKPAAAGRARRLAAAAVLALAAGCAVGPDYKRPGFTLPTAFKEAEGWKAAAPNDTASKTAWWEIFNDSILNDLELQVATSNQTLAQAAAAYEEARQLARSDRTTFLPTVSALGSRVRAKDSGTLTQPSAEAGTTNTVELQAAWEPDIWGKVRRANEADVALAQAAAADVAAVLLSSQSALAQDYIELRIVDENKELLTHSVADYRRTLLIVRNKYAVGVAAKSDVISAQTELDAARAQLVNTDIQRTQLEHAIAVLVGKLPAQLSIAAHTEPGLSAPVIPSALPSTLLERRPDVADAERGVAAANAKVGIQTAAYYPDISLSAIGGYEGSPLDRLFSAPFRFWSLGGSASEVLLDWGQRHDQVLIAKAAYDASVANYRQTVLSAFQQVEDNLAELRILLQEEDIQAATVKEAADATRIALNEYNAGTVDYTTVETAQVTELTNRETLLGIRQSRLTSSVLLIAALGGGWSSADLPDTHAIYAAHPQSGPAAQ